MKKFIYCFSAVLLITATGCKKDFLNINQNPNSPTESSISPDLILPRALAATASRMATSYGDEAGWMGYWARSGTYGPNTEPESYNITTTFEATEWSGWYDILNDYNIMEVKATAGEQDFYRGIAKIMKSIGFMYLVDQYNNVPYSKAFDLSGNILPAYDKGQDIYADLFKQLDTAVSLIKNADVSKNPGLEEADIMFGGDAAMWVKFANTQHLKLALRESQVSGFAGSAEVAKIIANGGGFLQSGETASVQPGYTIDNGKQNPFWDSYKQAYTGDVADQFNRANNYVLNTFIATGDVRYQYFFSPAASPLNGKDYYGYNYGEVIPNTDPKAANSSDVAGPGLAKSPTQPQWVITSVESLFLQAEAAERGWITTATSLSLYNAAVEESFIWLGVTNDVTTADDYLASGEAIVDWAGATNKVNLIVTQKYLAMVGVNNFEAWADYRRLGVPNVPLSLSPSRGTNKIPLRLKYPQDEFNYNNANVSAEGDPNPQTSGIFWDN
ncbi:MAG: SusD/RagB family nutrient-binding outer membrane lipoprotein [Ginsengibacter sp.]